MKAHKILATFDCNLINKDGLLCNEFQTFEIDGVMIIKQQLTLSDGKIVYFKSSVSDFEYAFKINLNDLL